MSPIEFLIEKTLRRYKEEEVEEMMVETGMVMVGVLGLWARFVRKPLLEFTGEMTEVLSEILLRMCRRDTTSYVSLSSTNNLSPTVGGR